MKPRIKDLAEHCDFYVGNEHSNKSYEEKQLIWIEKFADLIIAECHQVIVVGGVDDLDGVMKHFEIE